MDLMRKIENFVFGAECLGCGLPSENLDPWLCPTCAQELKRLSKAPLCKDGDVFCLYPMRPLCRQLIHTLKYSGITGMASYLVRQSSAARNGDIWGMFAMLPQPLYFVPVPLHRARYRERGYNQAEKIALALAVETGGKVCRWLRRNKFMVSQTKLSKEAREWNVAGAFSSSLPSELPLKGTVVVVDDVYTTGATTASCLAALGRSFPLPVKVCTLLYEEAASATADFLSDCRVEWDKKEKTA